MIEGLKPYPDYRESGLRLVGRVPKHWDVKRAKTLFREVDDRSDTGTEELLSVSHISGVRRRSELNATMFLAKSNKGHKLCRANDLVINTMWAWMGALGVSPHAGLVSPAYGVYRPLDTVRLLPTYVHQVLRSPAYVAEFTIRSTGIHSSRLRLYPEQFLRLPLLLPPRDEQGAIVRFLDHANHRIDRYVRAKRKLISLLDEQKRAIIHRAVTRGINPNVPLKESGVPWLGKVPAHWHATRVKNEFQCLNSRRIPLSATERGEMVLRKHAYYGASGVIDKVDDYLFDDDLILIAEDGANLVLRNLPLAIIARGKFWVNNHAHILKPRRGNLEYLAGLLETISYRPWITGAAQPKLTKDRLLAVAVCLAPRAEQDAIMKYVADETAPLRQSIERVGREVALFREYSIKLASDVVSGQLDVRDVVSRLPIEEHEPSALTDVEQDAVTNAEEELERGVGA